MISLLKSSFLYIFNNSVLKAILRRSCSGPGKTHRSLPCLRKRRFILWSWRVCRCSLPLQGMRLCRSLCYWS